MTAMMERIKGGNIHLKKASVCALDSWFIGNLE